MADNTRNVKISIEAHVREQIEPFVTVHYEGVSFDASAQNKWVEPRMLGFTPARRRQDGRQEAWTLNVNVYHRIDDPTTDSTHEVYELADRVIDAFSQQNVLVQDWRTGALTSVGYLRFAEASVTLVEEAVSPRAAAKTRQLNVSIEGVLIT